MKILLAATLLASFAHAQTCTNAVVTSGPSTLNINMTGCSNAGSVPTPPIIVPLPLPLPVPTSSADISIDGIILPQPSKRAFQLGPTHGGMNGAGSEVNAYAMAPSRCNTTPALTRSWQHDIDLSDYRSKNAFDFFKMNGGEALSYKFTVGLVDAAGGFIYNDSAGAVIRPTFMSVTLKPCDFDTSKVSGPSRDPCYETGLNGNNINWASTTTALPISYCRLVKGQTYYINLRFQDARPVGQGGSPTTDACTSGGCGGILEIL